MKSFIASGNVMMRVSLCQGELYFKNSHQTAE